MDAETKVEQTWSDSEATEAEAMGWIPPERAKKLPEGKEYVGPVEYMERNPLYGQMKELQGTVKELANHNQKIADLEHKRAEKQYKDEIESLKAEKVAALDSADHKQVVEIDEKIRTTEKPVAEPNEDFKKWSGENPWFEKDQFLQVEANIIGERLSATMEGIQLLDAVKSHLQEKYPDRFKNTNRDKPDAVEGGTNQSSKKSGKASLSDLNSEETRIFNNFKRSGIFKKGENLVDEMLVQDYVNQAISLRD